MKTYPFSALFSRMKYITRWCLMRSTRPESLSEHTADTAMLAHTLCLIGRHCTGTGAALRPEIVATAAIYHDAPEILTGDMPTPVKYKNDALRTAYKAVEHESARVMASLQPEELQAETQVWLTGSVLNDAERKILKAADRLSAVIKCIEEDRGGNREFEAAYAQQMAALHAMHSPEAEYFIGVMHTLNGARAGVAAQALGIGEGALDLAMKYVQERMQFKKKLSKFQRTQFEIADMHTKLEAGKLLVYSAACKEDAYNKGDKTQNYAMDSAMAKLFCGEAASDVTRRCVQLFGGYGYIREYQVERMMRDAKITEIYEGTSEAQRMVISGQLGIK